MINTPCQVSEIQTDGKIHLDPNIQENASRRRISLSNRLKLVLKHP